MKLKKNEHKPQRERFRVKLSFLVDGNRSFVKVSSRINWAALEEQLAPTYHDKTGAPGIDTRLMVALHYLKYQHDLSDEAVVTGWVENPSRQHLSGRQKHGFPIDPSRMTRWCKRLSETSRATALQVCARLKLPEARPLAEALARSDRTGIPLRIAAVAALGDLRGDETARAYLLALATGPEKRLRVPAQSALSRMPSH